jgi:hypothetical protein
MLCSGSVKALFSLWILDYSLGSRLSEGSLKAEESLKSFRNTTTTLKVCIFNESLSGKANYQPPKNNRKKTYILFTFFSLPPPHALTHTLPT